MNDVKAKGCDFELGFSSTFEESLNNYWRKTDKVNLKSYIKGKICEALKMLNNIGDKEIELKKVILTIDDKNTERISIEFDKYGKPYDKVALQTPSEILKLKGSWNQLRVDDDLKKTLKKLDDLRFSSNPFSCETLCHEFGHLQDAQRKSFYYTGEEKDKELHSYIEVVWNVLLDRRLLRSGIRKVKKDKVENCYNRKLKDLRCFNVELKQKIFEQLWQKERYNYQGIKKFARELRNCKPND